MHPDQTLAMAQPYQQELRRHAAEARRAAELQTPRERRRPLLQIPPFELGHRVASFRTRIAHV